MTTVRERKEQSLADSSIFEQSAASFGSELSAVETIQPSAAADNPPFVAPLPPDMKLFTCSVCGGMFKVRKNLLKHQRVGKTCGKLKLQKNDKCYILL
jgi:hypothetical protein